MKRAGKVGLLAALPVVVALSPALTMIPARAADRPEGEAAAVRCKATVNVRIADADGGDRLFFSKRKVSIRAGSCVRWVWGGVLPHNVEGPGFRSRTRRAPFRYRKRFAKARRTPATIICGIHPQMRMRVAVR